MSVGLMLILQLDEPVKERQRCDAKKHQQLEQYAEIMIVDFAFCYDTRDDIDQYQKLKKEKNILNNIEKQTMKS